MTTVSPPLLQRWGKRERSLWRRFGGAGSPISEWHFSLLTPKLRTLSARVGLSSPGGGRPSSAPSAAPPSPSPWLAQAHRALHAEQSFTQQPLPLELSASAIPQQTLSS